MAGNAWLFHVAGIWLGKEAGVPDEVNPREGMAADLPPVVFVCVSPRPQDSTVFPLGVGPHHPMAQEPGFDRVPPQAAGQVQLRHLVERGDRTEPTLVPCVRIGGLATETLMGCLAAHAQRLTHFLPGVACSARGVHGLLQQPGRDVSWPGRCDAPGPNGRWGRGVGPRAPPWQAGWSVPDHPGGQVRCPPGVLGPSHFILDALERHRACARRYAPVVMSVIARILCV